MENEIIINKGYLLIFYKIETELIIVNNEKPNAKRK